MIDRTALFRVGYVTLTGVSCGLISQLLKGRTIANWTWMASNLTFQQGAMIGSAFAALKICTQCIPGLFRKMYDFRTTKKSLLDNKLLIALPFTFVSSSLIWICSGLPRLSCLTFIAVSEVLDLLFPWMINPRPPFYVPPDWQQLDELSLSPPVKFMVQWHRSGRDVFVTFTEEKWQESLDAYQNALLQTHQNHGRGAKVLGSFAPSDDPGVLITVDEPMNNGYARYHQLAIVKNGVAYVLTVGTKRDNFFAEFSDIFNQILGSLRLDGDYKLPTRDKLKELEQLRSTV
jgi:hypothetical protein